MTAKSSLQNLELTASLRDLVLGRLGEFVRLHGNGRLQFPVTKNLNWAIHANYSGFAQHVWIHCAFSQRSQLLQVHDGVFFAKDVGESAFWQAAMEGHLSALEATQQARTAARTLTLVPAGRGLAHA